MKRLIGIIFLIAGLVLIGFGFYEKGQIAQKSQQATEQINQGQSLMEEHPVGKALAPAVGGQFHQQVSEKVAHYEEIVMWIMIIGAVIALIGILMITCCRGMKT